ncbi:MAG: lipocalin-like domain-containing protein [Bryobacteraceae bacterium]
MCSWITAFSVGSAQSRTTLIGTWKLISIFNVTDKGAITPALVDGRSGEGLLTYTQDGRMMAIIGAEGRKFLSRGLFDSPVEERAAAYSTSVAYAGRFALNGDKVVHHVEASSIPNWVNTDLVRLIVKLQGDRLTLRAPLPFVWADGVKYAYQME